MLEFGSATDIGRNRSGKSNQDQVAILRKKRNLPLVVLADGMGGYEGGTIASKLVIESFEKVYTQAGDTQAPLDILQKGTLESHDRIIYNAFMQPDVTSMGSTVVAVAIDPQNSRLYIANVGDSRAYLFHRSGMKQLSLDHSEVAELKRNNVLDTQQAFNYKRKNVLTQSISANRPKNALNPFYDTAPFVPDSVLLLCSDGLWGTVPEALIQMTVLEFPPQEAAERLVRLANNFGGPDNISVIIVRRSGDLRRYKKAYSLSLEDTR